jgi:hypothetical protein
MPVDRITAAVEALVRVPAAKPTDALELHLGAFNSTTAQGWRFERRSYGPHGQPIVVDWNRSKDHVHHDRTTFTAYHTSAPAVGEAR